MAVFSARYSRRMRNNSSTTSLTAAVSSKPDAAKTEGRNRTAILAHEQGASRLSTLQPFTHGPRMEHCPRSQH